MTPRISISPVRKSIVVPVDPTVAFEIFTDGIDSWWPKTHGMGGLPFKLSVIEQFNGGRWYARREDESEVTIARVLTWEPGRRLMFSWEIGAGWAPNPDQPSEVEIRFVSAGPGATRIELEHRNFGRLGTDAEKYRDDVDRGWPSALESYAKCVTARLPAPR